MVYLVCVDVGVKNLGLCIVDLDDMSLAKWERVSLYASSKYVPSNNVAYCRQLVQDNKHYFDNAHVIVIEKQIRANMRIIESVLQAMFYDKTLIVHARHVKMHFDLCMRNYRLNKMKAVEFVDNQIKTNNLPFKHTELQHQCWEAEHKKDDLADSMLLALYYCSTYSSNAESGSNDRILVEPTC